MASLLLEVSNVVSFSSVNIHIYHSVLIGSGHKAEHNIYIWDKKMGNLLKILEGPKELLDDLTVSVRFAYTKLHKNNHVDDGSGILYNP